MLIMRSLPISIKNTVPEWLFHLVVFGMVTELLNFRLARQYSSVQLLSSLLK